MNLKDGKLLVRLARDTVESIIVGKELSIDDAIKNKFSEKRGVFTTILTYPNRDLRGCIGFPYPVYPLWKAVVESAKAAAFEDPRFPPVSKEELKNLIFEITILTIPRKIDYKSPIELINKVIVGKHGLIVRYKQYSGLLLPQVPVEYGWDSYEFISQTCLKAGLPPGFWLKEKLDFFVFEGEIFAEKEPYGEVIKIELNRM